MSPQTLMQARLPILGSAVGSPSPLDMNKSAPTSSVTTQLAIWTDQMVPPRMQSAGAIVTLMLDVSITPGGATMVAAHMTPAMSHQTLMQARRPIFGNAADK